MQDVKINGQLQKGFVIRVVLYLYFLDVVYSRLVTQTRHQCGGSWGDQATYQGVHLKPARGFRTAFNGDTPNAFKTHL